MNVVIEMCQDLNMALLMHVIITTFSLKVVAHVLYKPLIFYESQKLCFIAQPCIILYKELHPRRVVIPLILIF